MPEIKEMWVRSLGWGHPLEEGVATHSSIVAWRIPWTEEPGRLQSMESQRVRHDWSDLACMHSISTVNISISISQFILLPSFTPWWPYICSLGLCLYFCFVKMITLFFSESTLYALIYSICFSPTDLLYSIWQSLGQSTIHVSTKDPISFLFNGWVTFCCIYVPHFLYHSYFFKLLPQLKVCLPGSLNLRSWYLCALIPLWEHHPRARPPSYLHLLRGK